MKVAIMQPYIFPYIGYFQLIHSVDKFVLYDDVNFMKQGWVNRNNVLINKSKSLFTVPLDKSSSFNQINETLLHPVLYNKWRAKFLKSLKQAYARAPYRDETLELVENVLKIESTISELAGHSVIEVLKYLNIDKEIYWSAESYSNTKDLEKADRIIEICKQLNSSTYINVKAGMELYDKNYFKSSGIELKFISPELNSYNQYCEPFIPGLSIIDVLMFNSPSEIKELLTNYTLL